MTQVTLHVPDNELDFFLQLVKKFNYETIVEEPFLLTQEQKNILDQRRSAELPFLSMEEANAKAVQKYGF